MAFFGNFINDIVKLPQKTVNTLGTLINDAKKQIVTIAPKVGDFVKDIPKNIEKTVDNVTTSVIKQVEKVQDLSARGIEKTSTAIGSGLVKIGDPLLKNPVLGGVALAGSGSALMIGGALLVGSIVLLKKL